MPFNRFNNPLKLGNIFENIGFANGEWRDNLKQYENIQGILIDTKFLMPFNRFNNPLKLGNIFENIGFANGEWRDNLKQYENIQGILIDTKFLMQNYNKKSNDLLKLLAKNVEETKI
ncbi:hypothetical protein E5L24_00890 [Helicobacter pylori]|nr:hypothetical protein E5L24_00890 [Helicobacter pylori]